MLLFGNFIGENGAIVEGLGVSYGCFEGEPPGVGELVLVRVWVEKTPEGDVFHQAARQVTEAEKAELEAMDEGELGGWLSRTEVQERR